MPNSRKITVLHILMLTFLYIRWENSVQLQNIKKAFNASIIFEVLPYKSYVGIYSGFCYKSIITPKYIKVFDTNLKISLCHTSRFLRVLRNYFLNSRKYCNGHIHSELGTVLDEKDYFEWGLNPLGIAATTDLLYQPQMIDAGDCGAICGIKIGRGNRTTRRKPAPAPLYPPPIPHDHTRVRTRVAPVGSQQLTRKTKT
jgi:hypothetical protein